MQLPPKYSSTSTYNMVSLNFLFDLNHTLLKKPLHFSLVILVFYSTSNSTINKEIHYGLHYQSLRHVYGSYEPWRAD